MFTNIFFVLNLSTIIYYYYLYYNFLTNKTILHYIVRKNLKTKKRSLKVVVSLKLGSSLWGP